MIILWGDGLNNDREREENICINKQLYYCVNNETNETKAWFKFFALCYAIGAQLEC